MSENENQEPSMLSDDATHATVSSTLYFQEMLQDIGRNLIREKYQSGNEGPVPPNYPFVCLDTVEHSEMETLERMLVNNMDSDNVILERARDPGKYRQTLMLKTYKEIYGSDLGDDPIGEHRDSIPGMRPRNPALDTIALKMKAIRLLNREGVKKPSQEQIKLKMEGLQC